MTNLPPITPLSVVPGVRSRHDDFGAVHVNQTAYIHWTVGLSALKIRFEN